MIEKGVLARRRERERERERERKKEIERERAASEPGKRSICGETV